VKGQWEKVSDGWVVAGETVLEVSRWSRHVSAGWRGSTEYKHTRRCDNPKARDLPGVKRYMPMSATREASLLLAAEEVESFAADITAKIALREAELAEMRGRLAEQRKRSELLRGMMKEVRG
jgi:hypothetical protein